MPIYICAILLMIAADQAVKYWAFTSLQAQQTIPLINGVFHLTYIENRGAAFSLFAQFDSRWIFVVLAIVITVAIFTAIYRNMLQTQLGCWSLILVAAGALGNAIDRVAHGFVVDMFDFRLIHFPVFNVADCYVVIATFSLILLFFFFYSDEELEFLSFKGAKKESGR